MHCKIDNNINKIIRSSIRPNKETIHTDILQEAASSALLRQTEALVRGLIEQLGDDKRDISDIQQALCAINIIRDLSLSERVAVLSHPTFNYWVKAMRRCSRDFDSSRQAALLPHVADFVWSTEAMHGPTSREWSTFTDDRGGLRCPTLGRFIELGDQYSNTRVRISSDGDTILLSCEDGLNIQVHARDLCGEIKDPEPTIAREGYRVNLAPLLGDRDIEVWSRDMWLRVRFTGTQQRRDGIELFGTDDKWYECTPNLEPFLHAFILLRHYWPEAYDEVGRFTRVLVPMQSRFDDRTRLAFTVSSRQGAIFVDNGKPYDIVDNVLHENAHIKLRQIQLIDPLLIDPHQEHPRFSVPWRKDKRPLPGILEGIFVFSHVAEFERQVGLSEQSSPTDKLIDTVADIRHGLSILKKEAEFTEAGKVFVEQIEAWVNELESSVSSPSANKFGT